MAISQADFYAFSQATGAPVPEDPEARARIAPQVMEWRRNQLKQPKEEGGLVDTLGKIALGAGALAAGIAGYRALRGRQAVSPVNVAVQEEVVRRAAQPIPRLRGVTQQVGGETARPPSPRPPAPIIPVNVRDVTPASAPPRGQRGPGIVDPWSGPAPTSYRGSVFESTVDTKNLLNQINSFVSAKGRYPETDLEFQEYLDYGQRLSRSLPAAEEEFVAYRPDPKEMLTRQVADARRQAATEGLLRAAEARRSSYQPDLPGINTTLMALRSPASVTAEEAGELVAQAESRPLSATPAQTNLFQYVKQAAEPEGDVVDRLLTEYNQLVERQARTDQRVRSSVREYQMELQGKALRIMDELRGDSLTEQHQTKRAFNVDQAINALESGEDQTTGRVRQQLQRNEDLDIGIIDRVEDQTNNIEVAASLTPDGIPVDQAKSAGRIGPVTAQEQLEMAKQEMIGRRQRLEEAGLRPGTVRFERALAEPFRTSAMTRVTGTGRVETALPQGPIRQTVQAVSASEFLPERALINVGPEAQITSTATNTAIRGASPSYQEVPAKEELRQLFGKADPMVPGAPDELAIDLPGRSRVRGVLPDIEPEQRSKQEIVYGILDRPATPEPAGGSSGIGVYGIERSYVPGAMSKETGQYSEAAARQPSYVPAWLQKKEMPKTGFGSLSTEQLVLGAEKTSSPRIRQAFEGEIARRETAKQSLDVSEAMRRARIEGRDPQSVLRSLGFNL